MVTTNGAFNPSMRDLRLAIGRSNSNPRANPRRTLFCGFSRRRRHFGCANCAKSGPLEGETAGERHYIDESIRWRRTVHYCGLA
jgi:hypothetical protein